MCSGCSVIYVINWENWQVFDLIGFIHDYKMKPRIKCNDANAEVNY